MSTDSLEEKQITFYNKTLCFNEAEVFLDHALKDVSYYRTLIKYLQDMQEGDSLKIYVDGPGGRVDTLLALVNAIEQTKGQVHTIVTGSAISCHSLLALLSPSLEVQPRARFFLHHASYGLDYAKHSDIKCTVDHYGSMLKDLFKDAYTGFLTPKEMKSFFLGKDFWFKGSELQQRLKNRFDYLESLGKNETTASKEYDDEDDE